jgi:hypothetical protein
MKKYLAALAVASMCAFSPWAQEAMSSPSQNADAIDLVVLLDSSQSMFAFNEGVRRFVLERVASEYLRLGDSFHLLSFAESQKVELSRVYDRKGAAQDIVARLFLSLPLGQSTDLLSAMDFLYRYVDGLPENGSRRLVVLISDLIHNPAAGSPYSRISLDAASSRVKETVQRMRERGWSVIVIKIPEDLGLLASSPSAGKTGSPEPGAVPPSAASAGDAPIAHAGAAASTGAPGASSPSGSAGIPVAPGSAKEEGGSGIALSGVFDEIGREGDALVIEYAPESPGESAERGFNLSTLEIDSELGERPYEFDLPLRFSNKGIEGAELLLGGIMLGERNVLARELSIRLEPGQAKTVNARIDLPESVPAGRNKLSLRFVFSGEDRASPQEHDVNLELVRGQGASGPSTFLLAALALGAFALLAFTIIAVARLLKDRGGKAVKLVAKREAEGEFRSERAGSPHAAHRQGGKPVVAAHGGGEGGRDRPAADAELLRSLAVSQGMDDGSLLSAYSASTKGASTISPAPEPQRQAVRAPSAADVEAALSGIKAHGEPVRVEFIVESQNPAIGLRNVSWMRPGQRRSIGGGSSDFLVYLVAMPPRIATIAYDGEGFVLAPARPELFPEIKEASVRIGFDEALPFVSPKGYAMRMKIRPYVSAIERINSLLLSLKPSEE